MAWSPDGSRIAVTEYDFPSDADDLHLVTWPGGDWSVLAETPGVWEEGPVWTPDGETVIVHRSRFQSRIVTVPVAGLLDGG